jgi:hypothetical protein
MGQRKRKRKQRGREQARPPASRGTVESPIGDAVTIAWTVAVTMLVACDVTAAAAHLYYVQHPQSKGAAALGGLMLLAGAIIGLGALALTPVVYRLRRSPPPTGFSVFAVCAAVAPILAAAARALQ